MKNKYWSRKPLLDKCPDALYYVVIGERSNGKSFQIQELILENYLKNGEQGAIIRRYDEDFTRGKAVKMFDKFVSNPERGNIISEMSEGKWNAVRYLMGGFHLCRYSSNGDLEESDNYPFCYGFAITKEEHYKSTDYPNVTTILFDEFISRSGYLSEEFIGFSSIVSTIVRQRNNVKIFLCANTISSYCPYFKEMGITKIKDMTPNTIDIYRYGESGLKVAVEMTGTGQERKKASNDYFAFDNPKLKMIRGDDATLWEIAVYPRSPYRFEKEDIQYIFFIKFDGDIYQCEVISKNDDTFLFIHRKTTPLRLGKGEMLYTEEHDPRPNVSRKILEPHNNLQRKIANFFATEKVFYQSNEIGEGIRNYLLWCDEH